MRKACLVLSLLLFAASTAGAQDSTQSRQPWDFLVEPYFMFPNMNGTTGLGDLPDVDVDASVEDIFGALESGFMLYAEAQNGTWALSSDFLFMGLEQDAVASSLIQSGSVSVKEAAWELAGLRRISPWLEGGVAGRLVSLDAEVKVVRNLVGGGTTTQTGGLTETWVDPVLVVRVKWPASEPWLLQLRGDFGGFGIGSDLTWQVQAYGGYRVSHLFQATVGYRVLDIDYETGSGQERFLYDITTSGPVARLGFNF
jgi:hypothetical protein